MLLCDLTKSWFFCVGVRVDGICDLTPSCFLFNDFLFNLQLLVEMEELWGIMTYRFY